MFSLHIFYQLSLLGPYCEVPCCFIEIGSTEREWGEEEAGNIWAECLSQHLGLSTTASSVDGGIDKEVLEMTSDHSCQDHPVVTTPGDTDSSSSKFKKYAVMSIGGGHYVPKMNDIARLGDQFFVGHALSTYMFAHYAEDPDVQPLMKGGWRAIVEEGIHSTRMGVPGDANLYVLVDKKAFKAPLKNAITEFLDTHGIKWTFSVADIKRLQTKEEFVR